MRFHFIVSYVCFADGKNNRLQVSSHKELANTMEAHE